MKRLRLTWMTVTAIAVLQAAPGLLPTPQSIGSKVYAAARHHDDDSDFTVREEQTVKQSYPLTTATAKSLDVNNVWGSIEVVGTDSNQISVVIKKTYRAQSQAAMDKAKKEVTLEANQEGNAVSLYVNGPFRCQNHCESCCCNDDRDRDRYIVNMDFQIQVPRSIELTLRTVNEGTIKVQGVAGDFHLGNVNGDIEMLDANGSGKAKTVNGSVKVTFAGNPKANSEFGSINGPIDLEFRHGLSADFRFKNFNGGIYSDFELSGIPPKQASTERHNGRFVFRTDRFTGGRVGSGGPEIRIENLNGDIRVLERHV